MPKTERPLIINYWIEEKSLSTQTAFEQEYEKKKPPQGLSRKTGVETCST